jgi:hypothetical protein
MNSSKLWRRARMKPRSRPWYARYRPQCVVALAGDILTAVQKKILSIMLNGDPSTGLLMHIIRFVMPSKSKPLKKLMYLFLEVCPKHDAQGKLRQEWILVWCVAAFNSFRPTSLTTRKQCHPV